MLCTKNKPELAQICPPNYSTGNIGVSAYFLTRNHLPLLLGDGGELTCKGSGTISASS